MRLDWSRKGECMFKKLSVLMLLAVAMVTKSEDAIRFDCLSKDKDYYNSDEMVYRRKHKCGCEQFCCINTATLTVSGLANFNGASVNIRNILNLAGVNLNNLFGISGAAGINGETAAVGLVDQNGAQTNAGGAYGLGLTTFANYYSTAVTVIPSTVQVPFSLAGPVSGIARFPATIPAPVNTTFVLPAVGTYEVTVFLTATTGGQLSVETSANGGTSFAPVANAIFANAAVANAQIGGTALITTAVDNTLIQVVNTSGAALTPVVGGGSGVTTTAGITIKRIA